MRPESPWFDAQFCPKNGEPCLSGTPKYDNLIISLYRFAQDCCVTNHLLSHFFQGANFFLSLNYENGGWVQSHFQQYRAQQGNEPSGKLPWAPWNRLFPSQGCTSPEHPEITFPNLKRAFPTYPMVRRGGRRQSSFGNQVFMSTNFLEEEVGGLWRWIEWRVIHMIGVLINWS